MSLKDKLKSLFTYNGEESTDDSRGYDENALEKMSKNIDLSFIKNPIHKAIVMREEIKEKIVPKVKTKVSLADSSENLYFMGIYYATESGKTFEEVKPLYDNFFNKNVVDESVYSNEDLLILKQATTYLKSLFSNKVKKEDYQIVLENVSKSEFLLQIINMSDYNKGTDILNHILENTYNIFDISSDYESLLHSKISVLPINGFYVSMLPELTNVLNALDTYDKKVNFLLGKISHLFVKSCIIDGVDVTYVNVINEVMQNIPNELRDLNTEYEKPVIEVSKPPVAEIVKEEVTQEPAITETSETTVSVGKDNSVSKSSPDVGVDMELPDYVTDEMESDAFSTFANENTSADIDTGLIISKHESEERMRVSDRQRNLEDLDRMSKHRDDEHDSTVRGKPRDMGGKGDTGVERDAGPKPFDTLEEFDSLLNNLISTNGLSMYDRSVIQANLSKFGPQLTSEMQDKAKQLLAR